MLKTLFLLIVSAAFLAAGPITFTLVQPNLTGTPGSTVTFQYQITNNSGGPIFAAGINADSFTGGNPDASAFDLFGFAPIANGASRQGPLFAFVTDPAVASSFNSGTFDLLVSDGDSTFTDLFANYTVTIGAPVPEPSTAALFLAGACLFLWRLHRVR